MMSCFVLLGNTPHYLSQMKSDCHIIFTDWSLELINNVCLLPKVLPGNTPQYLSQMKSNLHKTFSIFQNWSPELINKVCAGMHMHAQHV